MNALDMIERCAKRQGCDVGYVPPTGCEGNGGYDGGSGPILPVADRGIEGVRNGIEQQVDEEGPVVVDVAYAGEGFF